MTPASKSKMTLESSPDNADVMKAPMTPYSLSIESDNHDNNENVIFAKYISDSNTMENIYETHTTSGLISSATTCISCKVKSSYIKELESNNSKLLLDYKNLTTLYD